MTENCKVTWEPTKEQVEKIILPVMQDIAQQCVKYRNELQGPLQFMALMLRDIADALETPIKESDSDCSFC
tara:strand:- start:250 stop:462 length:213 start_codon:yes stop_codon:yes gene_type:complete